MPALKLPKPLSPPQVVEVEWLDAAVYPGEGAPQGMATMLTVGYYHAKERKIIRLASDYDPADKETRTDHIIPRVHIVRFTPLGRVL